jgi:hypothetical protein
MIKKLGIKIIRIRLKKKRIERPNAKTWMERERKEK